MREYQSGKRNYYIPYTVYRRAVDLIRDYPRMLEERKTIFHAGGEGHGGGGIGDPTQAKALRLYVLDADIEAVKKALEKIPQEYRTGVMKNICEGVRCADIEGASERTWQRARARFIYSVAKEKMWI